MDKTIGLTESVGRAATYEEALQRILDNPPDPGMEFPPQIIELDSITVEPETLQSRVSMNRDKIEEIKTAVNNGVSIQEFTVFFDSEKKKIWLPDGHHRWTGYKELGFRFVSVKVRFGTKNDAIVYAARANVSHGLQLTIEDRKKAAYMLFQFDEWWIKSSASIAEAVGVSPTTAYSWMISYSKENNKPFGQVVKHSGGHMKRRKVTHVLTPEDAVERLYKNRQGHWYISCKKQGEAFYHNCGKDYEKAKREAVKAFNDGFFVREKPMGRQAFNLSRVDYFKKAMMSRGIMLTPSRGRGRVWPHHKDQRPLLFDFFFEGGFLKIAKDGVTQSNFTSLYGDIELARGTEKNSRAVVVCYLNDDCKALAEMALENGVEFLSPEEFAISAAKQDEESDSETEAA